MKHIDWMRAKRERPVGPIGHQGVVRIATSSPKNTRATVSAVLALSASAPKTATAPAGRVSANNTTSTTCTPRRRRGLCTVTPFACF